MKTPDEKKKSGQRSSDSQQVNEVSVNSHALGQVASPKSTGRVFTLQTGMFEHGRKLAEASGATKPRPEDISILEDHSHAIARETYRDKFEPSQNAHDRIRESEYQKLLIDREEAEQSEQHALANLREAENHLARTPKAGEKPAAHVLLIIASILVIAVTVAPTLHDYIFHALDDLLAWFLSLLCSAFLGGLLTWAILSGRRSVWKWLGMAAGVAMGLGLGVLRLSSATELGEILFSVGLTIVECGVIILLEWYAIGLRHSEDQWDLRHTAEREAIDSRDNAQAEVARLLARIQTFNQAIADHLDYVEDRHNRNINVAELEAVAVKAVLDGYNAGIAETLGRIRGVLRRNK